MMTAWHRREKGPITEEKLLRAVNVLADLVEWHGPACRPLYQDLKHELAEFRKRQREDTVATDRAFPDQISKVA